MKSTARAWAIWVTGLPGSGKTVISQKVKELLQSRGLKARVLELDEIRKILTPNPTYSDEEREIVYASLAYMAKLLTEVGVNVIIDAVGNRWQYRQLARELIPNFAEVYLECSLEVCVQRERGREAKFAPSHIYKKAREKGAPVPGVNVPYEKPEAPEIVVDSACLSVEAAAQRIVEGIEKWAAHR